MRRVEIREAAFEDVALIAANARPADVAELAATGSDPAMAMYKGLVVSTHAWTGLVNDEPVCMFGVAPRSVVTGRGAPWLIGSTGLERYVATFIRRCAPEVQKMRDSYNLLENFVDARNDLAIRWLMWLGFTIQPAAPYGINGEPFHRFLMETDHV